MTAGHCPPQSPASGVADGVRHYGSAGELFEARNGGWERVPSSWVSRFKPLQRVAIDGDRTLVGVVTSFQFRPGSGGGYNAMVEVSYVHNGDTKSVWVEETRLTTVEDDDRGGV